MADEMDRRISEFIAVHCRVSVAEGEHLRRTGFERYGTSLRWLQMEMGLDDPLFFLDAVHPENVADFIPENHTLFDTLNSIPIPKAILTNSSTAHAHRVLKYLGVEECFKAVFDLQFNGFEGKPNTGAYERVLLSLGIQAGETMFIDDVPRYLEAFHQLGGSCILVDELNHHPDSAFQRIHGLDELPSLLETTV